MDQKTDDYKKKLEAEKGKLLKELAGMEKPEDFGNDADPDEEANEAESFGNQLATARVLKDRINDIDGAINRIASGTYGTCDGCGKKIDEAVLDVSPESKLCRECKKKL